MISYIFIRENKKKEKIDKFKNTEGYKFRPKKSASEHILDIDSMIIINPSMIEKIIKRNIQKSLTKIMRKTFLLFEDSDNGNEKVKEVLEDIYVLKSKIRFEYLKYLPKVYIKEIIDKIRNIEIEIKNDFGSDDQKQWGMFGNRRRM